MLTFLTPTRQEETNKPQEKNRLGMSRKKLSVRFNLLFLLLSVALCDVYGEAYAQDITLSYKNEKLDVVLKSISKQSGYRLFYNSSLLKESRPVTIQVNKSPLKQVMDQVFANQPLTYTLEGKSMVIRAGADKKNAPSKLASAPIQETITGTVSDSLGSPLAGVSVKLKGTNVATSTDAQGRFELTGASAGTATLVFSLIGYRSRELVYNGTPVQIKLVEEPAGLDEVVVVGYGSVRKADLTGAVATVNAEQIRQVNGISNVAQALQGQAPGVQVNQASGQPGEGMKIQIRGLNSIGASNAPLYVVDGLPLDNLSAQLNPEDIENISVLKDASSTAIYGSRGANGVIMITTKKGISGKTRVGYNGYIGTQWLRKRIDLIDATQFANLQNEVAANDGNPLPWSAEQIQALGRGTDWQDLVYRTAMMQNHDVNISGGNERTKYFTSFGYFNQDGIIRNSGFERLSFRTNIEHQLLDKLTLATNVSLQNAKYNRAQYESADGGGGIPWATIVMPPTLGVYDEQGNYTRFTGVSWGETNPVGISDNWNSVSNNLRVIGNTNLAYEIVSGLKIRLSAGVDHGYTKSDQYFPGNISLGQRTDPDGNSIFGVASKNYGSSTTFVNENTIEYQKAFDAHKLDLVAGFTYQTSKGDGLNSGNGVGFLSDIYETNNIGSAIVRALPSSTFSDNKLISYLARANYNYDDRYLLTLTGRYDGSSRFGANNKFAFFPSAAIAWNINQEEFLSDNETISLLKVRGSFGRSGNQAITNYRTLANVANTDVIFDNQINTGFFLSALENPNLKWETTQQLDLGLALGLFENRIQFEADYYYKRTTDLLLNVTLPGSGGFPSVLQNVGAVQNRGFEFQLAVQPNLGEKLQWTSTLNVSANRTKVLDLGNDAYGNPITFQEINTGGNWFPTIVGQSMMQLYGFTVEGIYQTDQEAIDNGEPSKRAGDYRFKNWDGEGIVNDTEDRTVLTRLEPKFTFGFNNKFQYKNFDLSMLIVGSYGNDIVNEFRKYNVSLNGRWTPTREAYENRWTGPGSQGNFDRPSENSGSPIRDYANSLWVENGSYLRLRDITVGYTLPEAWSSQLKISRLRVYCSAQNLLTLTSYSGYDPEVSWGAASVNGWDRGNYPAAKSVTAGLRVDF
ncbi:TonB-linked SusC/RagA family outer membrane protein [Sphingobacterium paludis]|uniref:TonB-linked SusC/RagA family outer membrane protein n=2 Tax=Sphingobacterium paludis TaxID=1476465 RepID=A0A4R7D1R9_9SPHI|nr:TonB-linked SusC/RagA family outer membrane protein [Sphingobacterium paludis]